MKAPVRSTQDIGSLQRRQAMKEDILDRDMEENLTKRWAENRDHEARDILINAHQKLVMSMARKFQRVDTGPLFEDLYNEGMVGLMIAAEKFTPALGNRFATFAQWWVLTQMQEYSRANTTAVRIGKTRKEKSVYRAITQARRRFGENLGPEHRECIAKAYDMKISEVESLEAATGKRALSLDQGVSNGEEESMRFVDTIIDEHNTPELMINASMNVKVRQIMEESIDSLDDRFQAVVRERFLSDSSCTLRDLAVKMNISAERVRQIEREALSILRRKMVEKGLTAQDLLDSHK